MLKQKHKLRKSKLEKAVFVFAHTVGVSGGGFVQRQPSIGKLSKYERG